MNLKTKQLRKLFAATLLGAAMLPMSCTSDNESEIITGGDPVRVAFNAGISSPLTRAGGTTWDEDDEIGIFMLKSGGDLAEPTDVVYSNYGYKVSEETTDAKDNLTAIGGDICMEGGTAYDFVAYYPWISTGLTDGHKYEISLADQYNLKKGSDHDLLYADTTRTDLRSNSITLKFNHKLSNITLNVTRGKGVDVDDYKNKFAVVSGMPTTATFDLSDGKTFTDLDDVADIKSARVDEDGDTYEVMIIPQPTGNVYQGRMISFEVSGKDYLWAIPDGFVYESGKRYTYKFILTTGGLELDGDVTISDWIKPDDDLDLPGGNAVDILEDIKNNAIAVFTPTTDDPSVTFPMGHQTAYTNNPIHNVTLTKGFKMSKYQITTAEYCEFLNVNRMAGEACRAGGTDGYFSVYDEDGNELVRSSSAAPTSNWGINWNSSKKKWEPASGAEKKPVSRVTWYGAKAFCEWIGGRLPSEAEWEYACKAGAPASAEYGMGDGVQITEDNLINYAWYQVNNTPDGPKNVGEKLPNAWGLYDMHGNVWEWCEDWYDKDFCNDDATDPVNTDNATASTNRVVRGGNYNSPATGCRSAIRGNNVPAGVDANRGFRVVFPL